MSKIIQIAKRTLLNNLNFKSLIYSIFILVTSLIIFYFSKSFPFGINSNDLRAWEALYVTNFLTIGIFWIVGIPALLYFSYILANSISEDINSGIALLIFTRPVSRREFVFGRFIGLFLFFNLISGILLFLFPVLLNMFFWVSKIFLFSMFKVSFALFLYGILLSFAIASIGIFLSTNIRKGLISLSILFSIMLLAYFLPFLGVIQYIITIKPFFYVVSWFDLNLIPTVLIMVDTVTNSYYRTGNIIIENFSSPIITFLVSVVIPIIIIILSGYMLSKQDIA